LALKKCGRRIKIKNKDEKPNAIWPPPPATPPLPKPSALLGASRGSLAEAILGVILGVLLHIVTVLTGCFIIFVIPALVRNSSQYGDNDKPILPALVFNALFVLCHLPAVLFFSWLRRQRIFFAYGLLVGSLLGMSFLIWLWKVILPGALGWGYEGK
jgi:hypothetical protein